MLSSSQSVIHFKVKAKALSHVQLFVTLWTIQSMEFLRSGYWSGFSSVQFSSVTQSCLTLCDPVDYTVHGILEARILDWAAFPSPEHCPNPGIEPRSPGLQADSLPAEAPGKPKGSQRYGLESSSHVQM